MGITAFLDGWGGYAEYTYVLEQSAARVPSSLSHEQAGGFPIGFRTAYAGLVERASLAAGEVLLVLGAAGSAGSAAVQLGNYSAVGVLAAGYTPEEDAAAWDALTDLADRKAITTPVGTVYPFAEVPSMIRQQGSPPPGKSVVRVFG